jgi:CRP-like cAMP-binding protein
LIQRPLLDRTPFARHLTPEQKDEATGVFRVFDVDRGEEVCVEGEADRSMVWVLSGELDMLVEGTKIGRIQAGEMFGEMTLFGTDGRRASTVVTATPCTLAALDEEGLKILRLRQNPMAQLLEAEAIRTISRRLREAAARIGAAATGNDVEAVPRGFLSRLAAALGVSSDLPRGEEPHPAAVLASTPGFQGRDQEVLEAIGARLEVVAAAQGDVIVHEGEMGDDAYIVAEGRVGVYRGVAGARAERVAVLERGNVFGQVSAADSRGRTATVRALLPTYLVRIPGPVFDVLSKDPGPEGRAFRRGMIDAFASQLRQANVHLVQLLARWEGR